MLHLYIGDGKGKTTAALGLALRAAGCGKKVYIAQFLKPKDIFCGELNAVKKYKLNIKIERFDNQVHPVFLKNEGDFDLKKTAKTTREALEKIKKSFTKKKFDVIILDEVLNSLEIGLVTPLCFKNFLKEIQGAEIILTGRTAPSFLTESADYISFVKKIKHPFDKNISARKGIEY